MTEEDLFSVKIKKNCSTFSFDNHQVLREKWRTWVSCFIKPVILFRVSITAFAHSFLEFQDWLTKNPRNMQSHKELQNKILAKRVKLCCVHSWYQDFFYNLKFMLLLLTPQKHTGRKKFTLPIIVNQVGTKHYDIKLKKLWFCLNTKHNGS